MILKQKSTWKVPMKRHILRQLIPETRRLSDGLKGVLAAGCDSAGSAADADMSRAVAEDDADADAA
jgi:hypothetical protein